ncbi:hypothetical protein [Arthrobacter sp. EpRS71]|uniref:type IV toxin-antitoxin system AbiEi family antitoxin domain-containing protein n=1 Tax=Arthrobacter sp. EpRS71 TaxID=1743141 RepID=UPI000AE0B241|nr:hypothetical protein [Arthrobacter sp. EpRS71]
MQQQWFMDYQNEFIVAARHRLETGASRQLSRRYKTGELVRVRQGVYVDKEHWLGLKPWDRYAATARAVAAENPAAEFCFETAALLWGLQMVGVPSHIHLATASRGHAGARKPSTKAANVGPTGPTGLERIRAYGVYRHYYSTDTVYLRGLRLTGLARTAVDVLARGPFTKGVTLADHAISAARYPSLFMSKAVLSEAAEGLPSEAKRQRVEHILSFADENSGSAGESLSRAQMHLLSFPAPELQCEFRDAMGFVARTDFFWRDQGVIGEFDGDAKYLRDEYLGGQSAREAVLAEKKREDRLRALGFTVVRWDWATANNPAQLTAKLLAAGLTPVKVTPKRTIHRRTRG